MTKYFEFRVLRQRYCTTQICNKCKRRLMVSTKKKSAYDPKSRQVCAYLIMQQDCCQFSPMDNLLTQRGGCEQNEQPIAEHVVRGVNLDTTCRQRRSSYYDDANFNALDDILEPSDFPKFTNTEYHYNASSCQLVEVQKCPIKAGGKADISDGNMLAIFGGTLCLIILGIVLIYRWCQYDRTRLAEMQKTRLQSAFPSGIQSPDSSRLSQTPSQTSPLLKTSKEHSRVEYNSCVEE